MHKINDFINILFFILWSGLYWKIVANCAISRINCELANNSDNVIKIGETWAIPLSLSILLHLCVESVYSFRNTQWQAEVNDTKIQQKSKIGIPTGDKTNNAFCPKRTQKKSFYCLHCINEIETLALRGIVECPLKWWSILTHFIYSMRK